MDIQALINTDWQALFLPRPITISFSTCFLLSLTCPLDSLTIAQSGDVDLALSKGQRHLVTWRNEGLMSCPDRSCSVCGFSSPLISHCWWSTIGWILLLVWHCRGEWKGHITIVKLHWPPHLCKQCWIQQSNTRLLVGATVVASSFYVFVTVRLAFNLFGLYSW